MNALASAAEVLGAGIIAGAMNSIAGGGSFISFPALLVSGLPPITANATNNLAIWLGNCGSVRGFRDELAASWRNFLPAFVFGVLGGIIGSVLLVVTPETTFTHLIPWLILSATALFAVGGKLRTLNIAAFQSDGLSAKFLPLVFITSIYGGYFGAGSGIVYLALLTLSGISSIHRANAAKAFMNFGVNGIACVPFILAHRIAWPSALLMAVGTVLGGYFSARISQRIPQAVIRVSVIIIGLTMAAVFFLKTK
jgi:uncharacterized membrane protein YfcA